jgi:hypothetical protein
LAKNTGNKRIHERKKEENEGLMKNKRFLNLIQSEFCLPISADLPTTFTCRIAFSGLCETTVG